MAIAARWLTVHDDIASSELSTDDPTRPSPPADASSILPQVMLEAIDALERTAPESATKPMAGYALSPVTPEAQSHPRVLWPMASSPQKTHGVRELNNPMSIAFNNKAISRRLEVGN